MLDGRFSVSHGKVKDDVLVKVIAVSALFTLVTLAPTLASAMAQAGEADLLPPLTSPRIHFGTGGATPKGAELFPELPNIPGEDSGWTLVQWRKAEPLKPSEFITKSGATPSFNWTSPNGASALTISKPDGAYVYDLVGGNGTADAIGESDLGLSADILPRAVNAAHELVFTVDTRITAAAASYKTSHAEESGAVLAQGGIAFRAAFHDPATHTAYSVQVGIPLINSLNPRPEHVGCHFFNEKRAPQLNSENVLGRGTVLPFKPGARLEHLTYHVDDYICDFISKPVPCRSSDGPHMTMTWPASAADLSNWTIGSVVISIGTQNSGADHADPGPQGDIKVGLAISDPRLVALAELHDGGHCQPTQ
jgi:hypothetical protein